LTAAVPFGSASPLGHFLGLGLGSLRLLLPPLLHDIVDGLFVAVENMLVERLLRRGKGDGDDDLDLAVSAHQANGHTLGGSLRTSALTRRRM
jgi:hypothetical protein